MTAQDDTRTPPEGWTDWTALERTLPLDDLPELHRALLELHRPGEEAWAAAFLRKVQGKVQATLAGLEREGRARRDDDDHLWLEREAVPERWRDHGRAERSDADVATPGPERDRGEVRGDEHG